MATVIGKRECPACEGELEVREAKAGAVTLYCPHCKFQGFAKTPKSSSALRGRLSSSSSSAPARQPAAAAAAVKDSDDYC